MRLFLLIVVFIITHPSKQSGAHSNEEPRTLSNRDKLLLRLKNGEDRKMERQIKKPESQLTRKTIRRKAIRYRTREIDQE